MTDNEVDQKRRFPKHLSARLPNPKQLEEQDYAAVRRVIARYAASKKERDEFLSMIGLQ